jgi:hypothetical protein
LSSPIIKPFRQLGGCADSGGRYRYRFSGFWKVEKVIDEPFMSILRSRKVVWVEGSSIVHFSAPQLFSLFLKSVHVRPGLSSCGIHMLSTSSM